MLTKFGNDLFMTLMCELDIQLFLGTHLICLLSKDPSIKPFLSNFVYTHGGNIDMSVYVPG